MQRCNAGIFTLCMFLYSICSRFWHALPTMAQTPLCCALLPLPPHAWQLGPLVHRSYGTSGKNKQGKVPQLQAPEVLRTSQDCH